MKNTEIQNLWRQNEAILEKNRNLNFTILKEVKLEKVKRSLNNILFLPISTLLFYTITASYSLYFAITHLNVWYFWFSGAVVTFFSIWLVISSIIQLKKILAINYNDSVIKLQKDLVQIKTSIIRNLRIVAWLLPFSPFIGIFVIKTLLNFDLMSLINFRILLSFGFITILLEILSLYLLNVLKPKNIQKSWLNWWLQGSGSQVDKALTFLADIRNFEKE
jgi:hypothetical protein